MCSSIKRYTRVGNQLHIRSGTAAFAIPYRKTKKPAFGWLSVETDCLIFNGRGGGIRTRDPLHPMQVRYQAALRPDKPRIITAIPGKTHSGMIRHATIR
ncbi:protein of unknown function [Denitratisoma oestradiolicum]|uniref:Uncharacterized protein n=1 Tax=Denitratisoma oestradiolicum TaxID=311182 RepID=A0A6S6XYX6_9PROT|nr:protein of unknown function [Denitratisoma oestradiolicum]